jgi:hypothetical protein
MRLSKQDRPRRPSPVVVSAVLAVALLFAIVYGRTWLAGIYRSVTGQRSPAMSADALAELEAIAPFPAAAWATRDAGPLAFDTPVPLAANRSLLDGVSAEVRAAIERSELSIGEDPVRDFHVVLSEVTYKGHVEVSLDGAVHGAMTRAATNTGDAAAKFSSRATTVGDLPARRASYRRPPGGAGVFIESVFVQDGRTIRGLQVLFVRESARADAVRVIDSLRAKPRPTTPPPTTASAR